ncbi:MAG: DUF4230 domain-containing protein [Bacteroidota bacterium]
MTQTPPRRTGAKAVLLGGLIVALVGVIVWMGVLISRAEAVSEEEVQSAVLTSLQTEAADGFVVTGRLTSSLSGSSARRWRLRLFNIETGRSTVAVRVPATMTYGFSLDDLEPRDIRFRPDGVVEVILPPLAVFSVEPELEDAEVDIDVTGQARLTPSLTEQTVQQTLRRVRPALREQAEEHLRTSDQPRVNTARALRRMLATPLEAAGVDTEAVRFRFVLAPGDTLDVTDAGRRRSVPAEDRP